MPSSNNHLAKKLPGDLELVTLSQLDLTHNGSEDKMGNRTFLTALNSMEERQDINVLSKSMLFLFSFYNLHFLLACTYWIDTQYWVFSQRAYLADDRI